MTCFKERIENKIARFGEELSFNGTKAVQAFVQELQSYQMSSYISSSDALVKPGLFVVMGAGESVSTGDTLDLDGRVFTVQKVFSQRLSGETVCKVAVMY